MTDMLITLFADYGPKILAWMLAALTALLGKYVWQKVGQEYLRGVLERAMFEINAAVLDVSQTYADGLKAGRADGTLTSEEKGLAKRMAIAKAKENLGAKGLERLGRILGTGEAVERWLSNKVEAAVRASKPTVAISSLLDATEPTGGKVLPLQPA